MDAKMKGMILSGMMGLCLLLGILAVLGSTWLVPTGDDAEEMEDAGIEQSYGLNTWNLAMDDVSSQFAPALDGDGEEVEMSDKEKAELCEQMLEGYEDELDASGECDGESIELSWSISDACDSEMIDDDDEKEECDSTASAGTMGSIGMWGGIICTLLAVLILVLPMAGVDALDSMPDIAKTIVSWAAGGLMLFGILLWIIMLPDTDTETGLGMSAWLGIIAAVLGLGAAGMDQFMPAEE